MKSKLVIALVSGLVLPFLLASAVAQPQAGQVPPPTLPAPPGATVSSGSGLFVIRDGPPERLEAVSVPPVSPVPPGAAPGLFTTTKRDYYYPTTIAFQPKNAEEANLAREAEALGRKLGDAKGSEDRSKIKTQLAEILEKQFDLRQKRHQDEIKELEGKVKKLKDLVDKRQENRKEIIAKRLDQILSDAEGLGW